MPTSPKTCTEPRFFSEPADPGFKENAISVFSIDYDGHSDICFDSDMVEKHFGKSSHPPIRKLFLRSLREVFHDYLESHSREHTEVYVGSNRQSLENDWHNHQKNRNGSCFVNLYALSQTKNWVFNKILLGDTHTASGVRKHRPHYPGTAMHARGVKCYHDDTKIKILTLQLQDVARRHPDKEIDFYFSDDDRKNVIFPALEAHFLSHSGKQSLPHNVTLHFMKFSWRDCLKGFKQHLEMIMGKQVDDKLTQLSMEQNLKTVNELKGWITTAYMKKIVKIKAEKVAKEPVAARLMML